MLSGIRSVLGVGRRYTMAHDTIDAAYGYAVWLRHVSAIADSRAQTTVRDVVEIGPGNSVATGICALLSGAASYVGLDVLPHLARDQAPRLLADVGAMFDAHAPIPGNDVYAELRPTVSRHEFPESALRALFRASRGMSPGAIARSVEACARGEETDGGAFRYLCPWNASSIAASSVDLVFSQAVLQEIPHGSRDSALRETLASTYRWLRPGGIASHQIDMGCYGQHPWNRHWSWSNTKWAIIRGRRDNFPNREPMSTYLALATAVGFNIVATTLDAARGIPQSEMQTRYASLSEEDRRTRSVHVVLQRPL
jgi:hypothetical protein